MNNMSATGFSQVGVGLLSNPFATKLQQRQQHQQGGMAGLTGNANNNMGNFQAGGIGNHKMNNMDAGNNMSGLMNTINFQNGNRNGNFNGNGLGNFNVQQSAQMTMNNSLNTANANNLNMNDFLTLQQQYQAQQIQQQKIQQQRQIQIHQQQLQSAFGMSNLNAQNINFALMAAQQNQNQSFIGQNPQFGAGGNLAAQGQTNVHPNQLLGQLMMNQNQQQNGIGAVGTLSFEHMAGPVVGNHGVVRGGKSAVPSVVGSANSNNSLPSPNSLFPRDGSRRMRGGVIEPFPEKLHRLLMEVEGAGRADVISFVANGRAFAIHKSDHFFKEIVPLYFRQSRLSSFKRQLNLYGFELINTGPARGGYYHELFVKERPELCRQMRRVAIKLIGGRGAAKEKITKTGKIDDSKSEDDVTVSSKDQEGKVGDVTEWNTEEAVVVGKANKRANSKEETKKQEAHATNGTTGTPEENAKSITPDGIGSNQRIEH